MRKFFTILFFFATAAFSQGTPKFVTAGKLDCAARTYGVNQVQTWCRKAGTLVQNTISDLTDGTGVVGGSVFVNFVDSTPGEQVVMIGWMLWFDHSDAKIHFQCGYQVNPGTQHLIQGTF